MSAKLNEADVRALMKDRSSTVRANTASKIAADYAGGALTPQERQTAEEIFRIMARDLEARVREALSIQLKDCPDLAHDVARALADDVDSVALPIIRHSAVLTDEDLIEIVQRHGPAKRKAVAERDTVSMPVADALVDTLDKDAVATLAANPGADISETAMEKALDAFGEDEAITSPLALRAALSVRVAERLVSMISDQMRERLLANRKISDTLAAELIEHTREHATLGLLGSGHSEQDVEDLVNTLHANKRLTNSIVMRALFTGNMAFFEIAMARLAGIPVINASKLIHDEGHLGLRALIARAGIRDDLYPALRAGVEVCDETRYDGGEHDRERFLCRVIERVLTGFEGPDQENVIGEDNLEFLLAKLRRYSPMATRTA